jgi:hypothetical protein
MRILITPNGKAEIISLSTSPSAASTKLNFFKKQKKENLINSYNERLKSNNNKENKKKRKLNSLNTERKNILNINIKKLKESDLVNIKELYNKPLKNIKEKTYHRIKTTNQIKSISLYDLMNKNVYNDMLNQMKKENDDKEKNCNVNNFQFRNQLTVPYDIPKIIDKVKNLKIQSNQYSLIKYIKTKESFNPILVKNYSNFSDRQLEKDNQLCKIILNNRKKDNIYKRIAEKKIKLKFSNYNNNLDRMKRDILCSARIINKYNNIKTNRELIKQTYEDFKRTYWKNINIDHLPKKNILTNEFD